MSTEIYKMLEFYLSEADLVYGSKGNASLLSWFPFPEAMLECD